MNGKAILKAAVLVAALAVTGAQAAEVSKVRIDDSARVGDADLVLNGAGMRTKGFMEIYIGALYAPAKTTSPASLLDSTAPRRLWLRMMRDIGSKTMTDALGDGYNANNSEADRAATKAAFDQFADILKKVGELKKTDQLAIDFAADGVSVSHNGKPAGKVASPQFAKALLKVWIGDKPVDSDLKKSLLGN